MEHDKMMETDTERRASAAGYMREHRAAWRSAGFKPSQMMLHEADRKKVTAYMELVKYERLLTLVKGKDEEAVDLAATRNTPKLPPYDIVEDFRAKLENVDNDAARSANQLFGAVRHYSKLYREHKAASNLDEFDDEKAALAVVYGNLASAAFKLAKATVESALEELKKGKDDAG
jgi:hypothetical protein